MQEVRVRAMSDFVDLTDGLSTMEELAKYEIDILQVAITLALSPL